MELKKKNEEYPLNPLDSAKFIMERAKNVSIDQSKILPMAKMISNETMNGNVGNADWINPDLSPPQGSDQTIIDWIFFVSTLNFSFWIDEDPSSDGNNSYQRFYKNRLYHGYEAFCAALNQALDNGIDLINPEFYSKISLKEMEEIFVGSNSSPSLPLLKERCQILNETGEILCRIYQGHFHHCIEQCGGNAVDLLQIIVREFPSYRDETFYHGQKVSFYKRAQILINDLWGYFNGHSYGHFQDLDRLTMFADYRVPQVLHHHGILVYSSKLEERLRRKELIPYGDEDEVEIRAASILSVEYLVQLVNEEIPLETNIGEQGQRLNAILIDVFLWKRRRNFSNIYNQTPFHRTRSIFY